MCEKAFPDLKQYVPLFSKRRRMFYHVDGKTGLWLDIVNTDNYKRAWPLWEQDQLQEMVINFGYGHRNAGILIGLSLFSDKYGYNDGSMEQLWLAFVMKEKFNKVWDDKGEQWT